MGLATQWIRDEPTAKSLNGLLAYHFSEAPFAGGIEQNDLEDDYDMSDFEKDWSDFEAERLKIKGKRGRLSLPLWGMIKQSLSAWSKA